jgi:UDP-glucose 4-epimerase
MRVVVTGASGNLGTAVTEGLVAGGHDVVGICRRPPEGRGDGVEWVALDLTSEERVPALRQAFAGADAVVHLAWGFQPMRRPAYLQRLDVGGTAAVLEAASSAGVGHLVHTSSVGAYSPADGDDPVDESWPTGGTPGVPYSEHKAAAERLLDAHEAVPDHVPAIARVRPSLTARMAVGASLARYALPSLVPATVLKAVPVLPLDRRFRVQLTHSHDIADAIVAVVLRRATGAFNLASTPVLGHEDLARALGARAVHVPWPLLRMAAATAWELRLQPVDPGWLDMGWAVPVMDAGRARRELDWSPQHDARSALAEALEGFTREAATDTPALRPRSWAEQAAHLVTRGPVSRRPRS